MESTGKPGHALILRDLTATAVFSRVGVWREELLDAHCQGRQLFRQTFKRKWGLDLWVSNAGTVRENSNRAHAGESVAEAHCGAPLVETDRWKPPQRTINLTANKGAQCARLSVSTTVKFDSLWLNLSYYKIETGNNRSGKLQALRCCNGTQNRPGRSLGPVPDSLARSRES